MIELRHVTAGYGGTPVLQDVSLSIYPGEVLVLVGPNGSGKSTLLRTALGMLPKTSGEILLDGREIGSYAQREIAQRIAFLTQSRTVPNITAYRMVLHARFPYLSYPRHYRSEDHKIVEAALERMGGWELRNRPMPTLSGGQRQKIYLAMAVAQQTEMVFLDEPTTYLDAAHQFRIMALAKALAKEGKGVVLVLHDLPMALETAQRMAVLEQGRMVQVGTPEEIFSSGVLNRVFDVGVFQAETQMGIRYFCAPGEGEN